MSASAYRFCFAVLLSFGCLSARAGEGKWIDISDPVTSQLEKEGSKIGYPGLTAGVAVDPADGSVFMVICDQGLWKSSDSGKTFRRVDQKKIGGRCETGFALNFDPAGHRLACFMIYGPSANTDDGGDTFHAWTTSHVDFGAVNWEQDGKTLLALRHESGGVLCLSSDAGTTWHDLGSAGAGEKIPEQERKYTGLGVFSSSTLVAAREGQILRSTDGGKSWNKVADAKLRAPLMQVHQGVGYWMTDAGVLESKDQGATWSPGWKIKATFGPWFSKDPARIVVVGDDGFRESADGGESWKLVAALPAGFSVQRVGPNYAWDSLHERFYASSMGKPCYRLDGEMPASK